MLLDLVFVTAMFAASTDAFLLMGRHIAQTRMDPIVDPGKVSGHLHTVIGGSAFSKDYNFQTYKNAACSTVEVQEDKSNYWIPSIMAKHSNGTYSSLPVNEARMYYFNRGNAQAFPDGLRMLVGNPNAQTPSTAYIGYTCQQGGPGKGPEEHLKGFPPYICKDFLRAEMAFPSCWDGRNLDSADHKSHMAYRSGSTCPTSHPIMVPELVLEIGFRTRDYPYTSLMLSNGDKTGYGLHGDFANGWDRNVLQAAMQDPTCNDRQNVFGDQAQCLTLAALRNTNAANNCRLATNIPQEEVGITRPIPSLPGCNLEWSAGQTKPACSVAPPVPNIGPPTSFFNFNRDYNTNLSPAVKVAVYSGFNPAPVTQATTTLKTVTVAPTPTPTFSTVYVYLCTQTYWSGCQNWAYTLTTSCKSFTGTMFMNNLGSVGPDKGRCQLYSDAHCKTPLGASFKYPGLENTGGNRYKFQSVKCFAS